MTFTPSVTAWARSSDPPWRQNHSINEYIHRNYADSELVDQVTGDSSTAVRNNGYTTHNRWTQLLENNVDKFGRPDNYHSDLQALERTHDLR